MNGDPKSFCPEILAESLASLPEPFAHVVALSGGGDSTALLLALHELRLDVPLRAIHVCHRLHPDAFAWADRCHALCHELGVPFEAIEVEVAVGARGLEAAAREARYEALAGAMAQGDMLLTGHHRDDQAETVLLHLVRGSGLDGLAGMAPCRPFSTGWIARPLLDVPREALRGWLAQQGREWIEDPDNDNRDRGRNYLRHRVMPLLAARWPGAGSVLARGAENLRDARAALDAWAGEALANALTPAGDGLSVAALRRLDGPRRRYLLRAWLAFAGLPMPDRVQLEELMDQAVGGRGDATPRVAWPGCEVRRYRGVLYAMTPLAPPPSDTVLDWDTRHSLALPADLGRLAIEGPGSRPAWRLRVGFRRGGERIRLPGRGHHTELKSLMQELGVPPWRRDRIPLVYDGDELAAVADWQPSAAFDDRLRAAGARIRWQTA